MVPAARITSRVASTVRATSPLTISTPLWVIVAISLVNGIGASMFFPANSSAVMKAAPPDMFGIASGMLRTFANIGMVFSFAVAILVASRSISRNLAFAIFVGSTSLHGPLAAAFTTGLHAAFYLSAALVILAGLLFFPVLGNLRPDLVSFLPAMRQYAGNWASAVWAFAPGAEEKLNSVTRSSPNQIDQLVAFGYEPQWAEIFNQQTVGWRSMHSQGRGLFSVLVKNLPDIDTRTVREAELVCNSLIGFNFGDGHLHNEDMIAAVQDEAQFAPGELVVVWVESQAIGSKVQHYKVIDAALGVTERGTWKVTDAVAEQPWLPNGPIPLQVTWTRPATDPRFGAVA